MEVTEERIRTNTRQKKTVNELSKKLMEGWTLLQESCSTPTCNVLLVAKNNQVYCINCEKTTYREPGASNSNAKSKRLTTKDNNFNNSANGDLNHNNSNDNTPLYDNSSSNTSLNELNDTTIDRKTTRQTTTTRNYFDLIGIKTNQEYNNSNGNNDSHSIEDNTPKKTPLTLFSLTSSFTEQPIHTKSPNKKNHLESPDTLTKGTKLTPTTTPAATANPLSIYHPKYSQYKIQNPINPTLRTTFICTNCKSSFIEKDQTGSFYCVDCGQPYSLSKIDNYTPNHAITTSALPPLKPSIIQFNGTSNITKNTDSISPKHTIETTISNFPHNNHLSTPINNFTKPTFSSTPPDKLNFTPNNKNRSPTSITESNTPPSSILKKESSTPTNSSTQLDFNTQINHTHPLTHFSRNTSPPRENHNVDTDSSQKSPPKQTTIEASHSDSLSPSHLTIESVVDGTIGSLLLKIESMRQQLEKSNLSEARSICTFIQECCTAISSLQHIKKAA